MNSRAEIVSRLTNPGVIPIIRADKAEHVMPACEALVAGGMNTLEITMTTPDALALIAQACKRFGKQAIVGAGTVMTAEMCRQTIEAGATFIVTPIMRPEIVQAAHAGGAAVILGAFTPTEAQIAHEAGADFIKVFPSISPAYIKAMRGPMPHIKFVPTSGVDLKSGPEYFAIGCVAVGVASNLVSAKILREENWTELTSLAAQYVEMARTARGAKSL
jgi:2-dehydro-3-deoxyphosphogluconate aldolase/(4S)-4-hydroxy-2-oxoglutarate aldolase